jgi:AhpD family alkylhydroperoxidase
MTDWKELRDCSAKALRVLGTDSPGIMKALGLLFESAQCHQALDAKTRELIALACAATTRCDGCISIHAAEAVHAGASREELLEALSIAVGMGAGASVVYSSHILEAFDQFAQDTESGAACCCCAPSAKAGPQGV